MNFSSNPNFTAKDKIELLERSIIVHSYIYYELDDNILTDNQYSVNTRQLLELKKKEPEAYKKSRYYKYFDNFESGTGFDLTDRVRKNRQLFKKIKRDAHLALYLKENNANVANTNKV